MLIRMVHSKVHNYCFMYSSFGKVYLVCVEQMTRHKASHLPLQKPAEYLWNTMRDLFSIRTLYFLKWKVLLNQIKIEQTIKLSYWSNKFNLHGMVFTFMTTDHLEKCGSLRRVHNHRVAFILQHCPANHEQELCRVQTAAYATKTIERKNVIL